MTKQQVEWAKRHEWFHRYENGRLWVVDNYTFAGKLYSELKLWEGSFRALRAWAGY